MKSFFQTFQTLFQRSKRKSIYSLVNIAGFAFGIAATLLIYLWINKEMNYDNFHSNSEQIYRVLSLQHNGKEVKKSAISYVGLANTLRQEYPQIASAVTLNFSSEDSPLQIENNPTKIEARAVNATLDFFNIFDGFTFLEGSFETISKNPEGIVLSKETAKKLFGKKMALGATIIIDKYQKQSYEVTGVVQIPENTHLKFGYMLLGKNNSYQQFRADFRRSAHALTYIKLVERPSIDNEFLHNISHHITKHTGKSDKLLFQPLSDIHLNSDYEPSLYDHNMSSSKYIWAFSFLALLIIFMASFNFAVLETARSSEQNKEIGIRKVNGATRVQIIIRFLSQSVTQAFVAGLLALGGVYVLLPRINQLVFTNLHLSFSLATAIKFILFIFLIGCFAGIYPAFHISSLQPIHIFKGRSKGNSKTNFIKYLVPVQFFIAVCLMVGTAFIFKQLNYIENKDLGFDKENIVVVPTGLWYDCKAFKQELLRNPNIVSVSGSAYAPTDYSWEQLYSISHENTIDSVNITTVWADEDFAKTYNLKVVKGHFLDMDYSRYWKELEKSKGESDYLVSLPIVINETAEKQMGFEDPIGQRIGDNVIVGVVKDFNFRPLHHHIGGMILTNDPQNIMTMNIKITEENKAQTLLYIRDIYRKYRDDRAFSYSFFEDMLLMKYKSEVRLKNLMLLFSIMAILISVLGVMSMALFFAERRTKEIGIRKVNGATISEVLAMLNKGFVKWVAIAFVIATPVAYYAMNKWLENFAYKTTLSWWIFVLAGLSALVIALLAVSWQSYRAASRNPVEALRYE